MRPKHFPPGYKTPRQRFMERIAWIVIVLVSVWLVYLLWKAE